MGDHEEWGQPQVGLFPNGLLLNEGESVIRELHSVRWSKAEARTAELIACVQPNPPSEERRNAVAGYVQRLITKCFPCQVFTFGSVPLKTYLPDGDIDLTAFSNNQTLKDTWAHHVHDILEREEKNKSAEFHVKEVQYIQADVKIIKCLVENIVVDISFNQLGGLCTLCFLEEVDNLINQNHLFKRSIILIKAWCYYESRVLGAHHGLISTYALETLVLYIFHVFNNSFAGPLEVLYRFLEFFSKFDWDNFCVSLWGPVPLSSLPDVTAEPPRRDGGELLLSKLFLEACSAVYAVFPGGHENQGHPFPSKHFNVIDPLRINNNLGRSVSKGNFFRIRSAFMFGAKKLARLLDCANEDLYFELNQFFMNTWDRHGNGYRPDAPRNGLWLPRQSNHDPHHEPEGGSTCKISCRRAQARTGQVNHGSGNTYHKASEMSVNQYGTTRASNQTQEVDSNGGIHAYRSTSSKPDNSFHVHYGRSLFTRTRSSPELSDSSGLISPQETQNGVTHGDRSVGKRTTPAQSDVLVSADSTSRVVGDGGEEASSGNVPSSSANDFGGVPLNFMLHQTSARRSSGALTPWSLNVQLPQGLVSSSSLAHYVPGVGFASYPEGSVGLGNDIYAPLEMSHMDADDNLWDRPEGDSAADFDTDAGNVEDEDHFVDKVSTSKFRLSDVQDQSCSERKIGSSRRSSSSSIQCVDDEDWHQMAIAAVNEKAGTEIAEISRPDSWAPMAPMFSCPDSHQRSTDNSGVLPFAFYPTGPPVPFLTMLPVYNFPTEAGMADSASQLSVEEGFAENSCSQNFDSSEVRDYSEALSASNSAKSGSAASGESDSHKSDILHSDFASHWQNLQYGRLCQNSRFLAPLFYPSPVMVPPVYMQGRFPWDGPGRPLSANMNLFTQLMSYGPRLVPVAPLQSFSNRPPVVCRFRDDVPRYRSGTGTYLPNPKVCVRDRHAANSSRRGNYNYDRSDAPQGERDGSWGNHSKTRFGGRGHNRHQHHQAGGSGSRADRSWCSHRQQDDALHSFHAHNAPICGAASKPNGPHVACGMYSIPSGNPCRIPNGPSSAFPSLVMLYPYDHSAAGSADHLEFGSLGPLGFPAPASESSSRLHRESDAGGGGPEDLRFHTNSMRQPPPEPPSSSSSSSPHIKSSRSRTQNQSYQLNDEDFPPLVYLHQHEISSRRKYIDKNEEVLSDYEDYFFMANR